MNCRVKDRYAFQVFTREFERPPELSRRFFFFMLFMVDFFSLTNTQLFSVFTVNNYSSLYIMCINPHCVCSAECRKKYYPVSM